MKRLFSILSAAVLVVIAMCYGATKNYVTLEIDINDKEVDVTGLPGLREKIDVRLTNTLTYAAADMKLVIIAVDDNGTNAVMAVCTNFTDQTGYFEGELDLGGTHLVEQFSSLQDQSIKRFTLLLMDVLNKDILINDVIDIQNNPYVAGMASPTVIP